MSNVSIECCNPLDRADEIRELFRRNDQPGFDAVFERVYRERAKAGLTSWIGRVDGRVVMHISVNPVAFQRGGEVAVGGVLGDLMVDEAYRDFWSPVRLVRRMVSDLRAEQKIRFLFTTATPEAVTIFKAGGFKPFGQLRRFVSPTYSPYLAVSRLRARVLRRKRLTAGLADAGISGILPTLSSGAFWRPRVEPDHFTSRIPRLGFVDGTWITTGDHTGNAFSWSLVSRHGKLREAALADAFWTQERGQGLVDAALAAATHARRIGFSTLSVTVVDNVAIARDLKRAGFFARAPFGDLLLNPLHDAPDAADDWFLTGFFMSSW